MPKKLRAKVLRFAEGMNRELDANRYKDRNVGTREGWKPLENDYLIEKLLEEVAELIIDVATHVDFVTLKEVFSSKLTEAAHTSEVKSVKREAFDVANIAMFLVDNNGGV